MSWFNFASFNVAEYERNSMKGWGDWNDIIPGKFIAFSGPLAESKQILTEYDSRKMLYSGRN